LRASESRDAVLTVGVCSFEQGFDTKGTGYALTHSLNQWLHLCRHVIRCLDTKTSFLSA